MSPEVVTPHRESSEPEAPARILVVDDQPANIQIVGTALGKFGHEIVPASNGPSALRRMEHCAPDLVLLDLLMPDMDGCEVCRRIRANPEWNGIPVIFLSAADDKDLIVRALEAGGVDYVTKPFNHAELLARVRTQLALKSARDRLKQLAEDKDELLGILTHDLKNHLGGMQMSANVLRDRVVGSEINDANAARLADNIARSSGQLLGFVKEFLANAATDHGFSLKPETLNFAELAASTVRQYEEAAKQKDIQIQTCFPDEDTRVRADASALGQVLDNLLSNALKFSPSGKSVLVSVAAGPGHVECRVEDHGPGFTDGDRSRMFRRYARLSARPTGGEPSTGLGLSIVRKLVDATGGELNCESTPGGGATFIVRLPAVAPGATEA